MNKRSKEKVNKFVKGSISILLAFLLSGVLSLGALLVEGSRYQQAKKQLEESSINSALSLLAFYDSDIESRFGLYGIDSKSVSADVFLNYLLFNSDCTADGVYSANNISQLYNVTSGTYELKYDLANYQVLKRQILEYEKYRAPLNLASEMLDIDKMIKELKKNIEKAIPGLENMLEVCGSVAEIAEAIKALYCLYKDVQQLQLTIGRTDSLGDLSNQVFGQAWEAVEGLFSDKDWPSHDPTYDQAYSAFQTAVNNKVQYMKNNPAPPDPGPKPTDADAKLAEWNKKNNALIEYNKKISGYNDEINTKKSELVKVIGVLTSELGSYKTSLTSVSSALDKADKALKDIKNRNDTTVNTDTNPDIFSEIKSDIITPEIQKPDTGIAFLNAQKEKLNNLNADDINASYNFGSNFNKGQLFTDGAYFMSKGQATGFVGMLATINILKDLDQMIQILKAMWDLVKVMQPFPSTYNFDCVVELNSSTTSILPSKINGGAGTSESVDSVDIGEISAALDEAKELLGSGYLSDINSVDPNNRLQEAELSAEISRRIDNLSTNLNSLLSSDSASGLLGSSALASANPWPFISTIFKLVTLLPTLIEIIDDIIFIAQHFEEAMQIIISSLGENLLLNQYIVDKFPNRTSDKNGDKFNKEISGYSGDKRQYFPDNNKAIQTFSGAQVEYVIGGSYSEKANQQKCFWSIFAIRALNNIFGVLTDEVAMNLIGACNIAAPLVFILWVYLESNIDMNMLVSGMEVPLIKSEIILSPQTLMDNVEKICTAFDDIDEDKAKEEELSHAAMKIDYTTQQLLSTDPLPGTPKMKYQDYLWFYLFFTPNQTKVMRVADLMQMEMRFKKQAKGTDFQMQNLHTYVRCEAEGTFNSILPVISLSNNTLNGRGFKVKCVKYVGY